MHKKEGCSGKWGDADENLRALKGPKKTKNPALPRLSVVARLLGQICLMEEEIMVENVEPDREMAYRAPPREPPAADTMRLHWPEGATGARTPVMPHSPPPRVTTRRPKAVSFA